MDTHDVRVKESRCQVGLTIESLAELGISRHLCRQNLQSVSARKPRMLSEVHLAHTARTHQLHNPVPSEDLTLVEGHGAE
jgi:hypothetical protein